MATNLYVNKILVAVPDGAPELSARKLEVDRMLECDPELMQGLYEELAADFENINYNTVAGNCRKRAEYWRTQQ